MANYDGSLKFDTKLNSKGFSDGAKLITGSSKNIISSLKSVGTSISSAFNTKNIVSTKNETEKLQNSMDKLKATTNSQNKSLSDMGSNPQRFNKLIGSLKAIETAIAGAFIIKGITDSVKEAEKLQNAMTGLKSIMDGQGKSYSTAANFIKAYTQDGLIPQTEAITAYKNLALRGYDTSQIQKVMNALKDSATFGRQASLTLGGAVETASEGLKNENSILVDNAGVTKNVAQMWQDYAKSIGVGVNSLTKQQKIQAEVNGIMEETKYQTGDAITYANTYSGMIARMSASWLTFQQIIGGAFMQIFQAIIPVIQTVINYLISLANVFAQVVSLIFGKQVTANKNVAKSSKAATNAIADQGNAAEKAGKQAQGALLPFDKLNVLSEETASGSSGSGSGGAVGIDTSSLDALGNIEIGNNISVSPKIQQVFDYLKDLTSGIDFTNIKNSLDNLKQALEPFAKTIFSGLKWGLENVIMPIVKFTINRLLPDFFNILAGAINILNSILKGFQPLGQWLWNNFLEPISTWTANALDVTLSLIADALKKISNWASENQPTIDAMVTSLVVFFGLWKLTELLAFIQMSGGLIGAFTAITGAIWTCTGAKIADKLETIILTAMYAGDFLVSIVSGTGALIKQILQWGILTGLKIADAVNTGILTVAQLAWNLAASVGTGITWALAAAFAFLTSPIGLVVIAIAALIGIGVLLYKNWDAVKYYAGTLWDGLRDIFGKIGNFIGGVWNGMASGAKGAFNAIIYAFNGMINFLEKGINAIPSNMNKLTGVFSQIGINVPKIPNVSIPRIPYLATGAIIPPNAEFMAVLGDQKHGRNLEAPEDLIRKIVREESGNRSNITKVYLNKRQIAEAVNEVNQDEESSNNDYSIGGGAFAY